MKLSTALLIRYFTSASPQRNDPHLRKRHANRLKEAYNSHTSYTARETIRNARILSEARCWTLDLWVWAN